MAIEPVKAHRKVHPRSGAVRTNPGLHLGFVRGRGNPHRPQTALHPGGTARVSGPGTHLGVYAGAGAGAGLRGVLPGSHLGVYAGAGAGAPHSTTVSPMHSPSGAHTPSHKVPSYAHETSYRGVLYRARRAGLHPTPAAVRATLARDLARQRRAPRPPAHRGVGGSKAPGSATTGSIQLPGGTGSVAGAGQGYFSNSGSGDLLGGLGVSWVTALELLAIGFALYLFGPRLWRGIKGKARGVRTG